MVQITNKRGDRSMKKVAAIVLATAMTVPLITGCGTAFVPEESTTETTVKELGPARAQDDYYRFVNQERFNTSEFEYGQSTVEIAFKTDLIDEQIEKIIDDCVAGSGYAKGSEEDIIKTAYEYFQSYDYKNEPIPADLMAMIEAIDGVKSLDELLKLDAKLVTDYGTTGFFEVNAGVNPLKPTERIVQFNQLSGVLKTSFEEIEEGNYVINSISKDAQMVLTTRGYDKETAEKYGKALALLALDVYGGTDIDITKEGMPFKYQKILTVSEMKGLLSNVDLDSYLTELGIDKSKVNKYLITDEGQLKALNKVFTEENLDALKTWELGMLYSQYVRYIAPHYQQFESYVERNYKSEHDQAIDEISRKFNKETDPIYVERHYSPETDKALRSMCDDIRAGYRKLISSATWLSDGTRAELLQKLENIVYVTGTDLKRHNNAEYANIYGKNYYELTLNYTRLSRKKIIDEFNNDDPISRKDVGMPMQMMNACYDPGYNNITITSAITNEPFFSTKSDYYTNLGGLGAVIAHEMGHAFDSNCIVFNSKGEYDPSWIPEKDLKILEERNEKAIKYFEDNFTVFGIYHVDGDQTLGENYADLGGVECITSLCKTKEDRIKLFESYATIWCGMCTDEVIVSQVANDPHSPSYIRVNAILSTIDSFYETYDVKEGDGMYIAPEKRISRWH